ncbi:hypothetical protein [Elioraea rosea]|uniref:hypothetical protein n=1 Tax=Elioraea rosea TaxID=2492390 RepID=UPI001183F973|nr:hypothetical protein [Elioraea rosea]
MLDLIDDPKSALREASDEEALEAYLVVSNALDLSLESRQLTTHEKQLRLMIFSDNKLWQMSEDFVSRFFNYRAEIASEYRSDRDRTL